MRLNAFSTAASGFTPSFATSIIAMGVINVPFAIPNIRIENPDAVAHTRIGWFRSVSNIPHAFAVQSFVAELAAASGRDPKDYLLQVIGPPRVISPEMLGDSPITGATRNPWNTAMTTGGSSAGAGAAAAAWLGPLHQGSDGAGSIRIPSSFCGLVGVKASYGRVPLWPVSNNDYATHAGPMTRTVADAALMQFTTAETMRSTRGTLPLANLLLT